MNRATNNDIIIPEKAEESDTTSERSYDTLCKNESTSDSDYIPATKIETHPARNITMRIKNKRKDVINVDSSDENTYLCQHE